ncbi:MAG: class I SAM-dependent methyltransferase [Ignavibacteriales bacterium]
MSSINIDQMPEAWSKFSSNYEQTVEILTSQYAQDVLRLLDIRPGEKVIDVAAGLGAFSLLAAKAGAEVLSIDFSPGMISKLRERIEENGLSNMTAEVMDGQNLEVPDRSFDISVSVLGVIFFPDIKKGLSEMKRVLRPGGRSTVVCFSELGKFGMMVEMEKAIRSVIPDFRPPEESIANRMVGADSLKNAMEGAGYKNVKVRLTTHSFKLESPQTFWDNMAASAPPIAGLIAKVGPEKTAQIGEKFVESLMNKSNGGNEYMSTEVCIGIGKA